MEAAGVEPPHYTLNEFPNLCGSAPARVRYPVSTLAALDMKDAAGLLDDAGRIVAALTELGLEPVLVGGMALVTLGSRRVTRDFDFVVAAPGDRLGAVVDVFYDDGLELAARVNDAGDITATITTAGLPASDGVSTRRPARTFSIQRLASASICCLISRSRPRHSPSVRDGSPSARNVSWSPRRKTSYTSSASPTHDGPHRATPKTSRFWKPGAGHTLTDPFRNVARRHRQE